MPAFDFQILPFRTRRIVTQVTALMQNFTHSLTPTYSHGHGVDHSHEKKAAAILFTLEHKSYHTTNTYALRMKTQ